MGTIEVWARPVRNDLAMGAHHLYLKYTDDSGQQFFLSGRGSIWGGGPFEIVSGEYRQGAYEWQLNNAERHQRISTIYSGPYAGTWWETFGEEFYRIADNTEDNIYYLKRRTAIRL